MAKNTQLLYNIADLILKISIVDSSRNKLKKLYRAECNITDKKEIAKIFYFLKMKFNVNVPESLKNEVNAWMLG